MARSHTNSDMKTRRRQLSHSKAQGNRPQGIKKEQPLRKSQRLQAIRQTHKQSSPERNHIQEVQGLLSPPASKIPDSRGASPNFPRSVSPRRPKRKRNQEQDAGDRSASRQEQPSAKRLRTKSSSHSVEKESHSQSAIDVGEENPDPLLYWIQTGRWRREYFEQDSQVREDFERGKSPEELGRRDWLQGHRTRDPFQEMYAFANLHHFLARKKSSASLRHKQSQSQSQSTFQTPSDQPSGEDKGSQYGSQNYELRLQEKGSYMCESALGVTNMSQDLCQFLLENEQTIPQDTLFRDDLFKETCTSTKGRNEAIVVRDITPLICPSAQVLRLYGAEHLNILHETVDEGWINTIKYEGTLPKPDYAVGFGRSAFTQEQVNKLKPLIGAPGFKVPNFLMATTRMYFPFFTCEVKCGDATLDFADRQNAQNMSIALRALVVLFKWVKREKELHREILTFSVSHDNASVRIYGHYPVIEGDKITFFRHEIHTFAFTALNGKEKWTTYKFVKNVFDHHSLRLHKLICSGIDDMPADINFDLSQSASFSQSTPPISQQSNLRSTPSVDNSQLSSTTSQNVSSTTSFAHPNEPASKKSRKKQATDQKG